MLSSATLAKPPKSPFSSPSYDSDEDSATVYVMNAIRITTTIDSGELPPAINTGIKQIYLNKGGTIRSSSKFCYGKVGNVAAKKIDCSKKTSYDFDCYHSFDLYSGDYGRRVVDVPPSTPIEFEIKVHSIVRKADLNIDSDLLKMASKKFFGNELFRLGRLEKALKIYKEGSFLSQFHMEQAVNSPKYGAKLRDAFVDLNNNIALAQFKMVDYVESKR